MPGLYPMTDRVKIACFMWTSLLAGCAGLLVMCQIKSGDPIIGRNLELGILTGVILGGVSFFGGRGSAVGTLLGILMIQVMSTGLVLAHLDSEWQVPTMGVLLAIAAAVDVIKHKSRE